MTAIRLTARDIDPRARPYNALFDGTTNDNAALQAAFDAAGNHGATVAMPHGTAMFSNLKVAAHMRVIGSGMEETILKRIPGSTGTALREKTIAEGNPDGATGLWVTDLLINGNGTTGDGLDIGNQVPGEQLNFCAGLERLHVRNFTSGTGMIIRGNATRCEYIWSNLNDKGIVCQGGGNTWVDLFAEQNTTRNIVAGTLGDKYFGIQIESTTCVLPMEVTGNQNAFFGVFLGLGSNHTKLIQLSVGSARSMFFSAFVSDNGATYTHLIYDENWSTGTGSSQYLLPVFHQLEWKNWFYNAGTGIATTLDGESIDSQPADYVHIGKNGRFRKVNAALLQSAAIVSTDRPSAVTEGAGSMILDITIHKLIISDGTQWRDTMGNVV